MIRHIFGSIFGLLLLFTSTFVFAQSFSISGTFSLPSGSAAPSGGASYTISTDPLESIPVGGGALQSSTTIIVQAGSRVANYSVTLRDQPPGAPTKKLRFKCNTGCSSLGLVTEAYWSLSNGAVGENQASDFAPTQNYAVNIETPQADVFSGIVRFPDGVTATGGETITVLIRASSFSNAATFSQNLSAQAGQTFLPFYIGVPILSGIGGWNVELSCNGCGDEIEPGVLFPTTRNGDPMTQQSNQKFFFLVSRDNLNMSLTFFGEPAPPEPEAPDVAGVVGSISLLLLDD